MSGERGNRSRTSVDARERSALAWAETVPDDEAAAIVFSEKELVDLALAIG